MLGVMAGVFCVVDDDVKPGVYSKMSYDVT